jgi:hypothetical protein
MKAVKRALARAFYETGPVCFACHRWSPTACPGHEYGGTITQWRSRTWARRFVPSQLYGRIDCRWTLLR